ncbi:hypothetical protein PMI24_03667 [Pseudomonas sp. GM25]|nr:hypothetical protein PMI24_03667 [Pseudomonas sp. GM25]
MTGTGHDRDAAARCSARQQHKGMRVILPRICRLQGPADNCHSNKYPLWVSAIDENARSLRPDVWRVNPQKEVCRGMWRVFRKGSGLETFGALEDPIASRLAPTVVLRTQNHCGSEPARDGDRGSAEDLSWQWPTTDPSPNGCARGSCHAHTASRQSRPRGSAGSTAAYRSDRGWPGRSPACTDRPCSARR